jgi:hypothetical protein
MAHAAEPAERSFCADRPGKATPSCTLDQGRVQLEVDMIDSTVDHSAGVRSTDLLIASPQLRIGLTPSAELQLAWTPYEQQTARGQGLNQRVSGVGDVTAGMKLNLTGNRDGVDVALQPFVKLPTARQPLGNGKVEGGMSAPVSISLPSGWSLGLTPELDLFANDGGDGRHLAGAFAVGIGHGLVPNLSFGAEIWMARDFVSRAATQASGDLMLAWTPPGTRDLQLDAGVNLGLNSATPDAQIYAGIAKRF